MFIEQDVEEINAILKRDGIDFRMSLAENGQSLKADRLDFGGCEDQDGALHSVISGYFREKGKAIRFMGERIIEEDKI